ncbi:GNAT family N-acetyltransferase [Dactylosporangium sp. NPDC000244]|uniref:GNAT family N-acetyltransferase n=1 Tax=Dactylosporangium sp. NPDC000244 TaxID=3154365 RepID=UPI00332CA671
MDFAVSDNAEQHRFEIRVGGERAGMAFYRLDGDSIVFTHTEVESSFEGQGVGSKLANGALTLAKDRGLTIVAQCPFIAAYLKKHPELAQGA